MGLSKGGGPSPPPTTSKKTLTGLQLIQERQTSKIAIIGDSGTGKTYTLPSLIEYLIQELKLPPSEILIEFIDLDSGLQELLNQGLVSEEYLSCINYSLCSKFEDVEEYTRDAYQRLNEHTQKVGHVKGSYIIIDNLAKAWEWARDSFAHAVYGKSMVELMKEARKSQVDAKKRGTKGKGVFNQYLDYAVINPLHNDWAESFKTCGFNYIWLSTWKWEDVTDENDKIIDTKLRFGQMANEGRVSHVVLKYYENKVKKEGRRARFMKSRSTSLLPTNIQEPTWKNIIAALKKVEDMERKKRTPKTTPTKSKVKPSSEPKKEKPKKKVEW